MRRISLALVCCLCLSACAMKSDLPPEEVLRRSAQAVDQLQAANFTMRAEVSASAGTQFTVDAHGVLSSGGKQFQFSVDVLGSFLSQGTSHSVDAQADVAVSGENNVYFRLRKLNISPSQDGISQQTIDSVLNQWWQLPVGTSSAAEELSPDPQLLRLQANVMRVLEDRGIVSIDGSDAYHYHVALDPEKFVAFLQASASKRGEEYDDSAAREAVRMFSGDGNLWIDRRTMFMRKIEWAFGSGKGTKGSSIRITAALSDYNQVSPPAFPQDAKLWELGGVFDAPDLVERRQASSLSSSSKSSRAGKSSASRSTTTPQ